MIGLEDHPQGVLIPVRAHPGAKKDAVLGERQGALRIAVAVSPEQGKANEAIRKVLAVALGCGVSRVELVSGPRQRAKRFLVAGMDRETAARRIAEWLEGTSPKS